MNLRRARSLVSALASALAALVLATRARAVVPVRLGLPDAPVVLHGRNPSTQTALAFDAPDERQTQPVLDLEWLASDLVDGARSTVSVELDGRFVRTARLASAGTAARPRHFLVPLGPVARGFHTLRVSARLVIDQDPCQNLYDREAWLRLEPASAVTWTRAAEARARTTLADLPDAWTTPERLVRLTPPATLDPATALAYLEADGLVRAWGLTPVLAAQPTGTATPAGPGPALVLRTALPGDARLPTPAGALVELTGPTLTVTGRDAEGLARALVALRSPRLRALCQAATCLLPDSPAAPVTATDGDAGHDRPRAAVLTLADVGYPAGQVFRGTGRHGVRVAWRRPAGWTLRPWPEVHLTVQLPHRGVLDPDTSTLVVALNDRTIASWDLGAGAETTLRLSARIPPEFWTANEWVFAVTATLRAPEARRCRDDDDDRWLALGADSTLIVPRLEQQYAGLAAFDQAVTQRLPALVWTDGLGWPQLAALGAVVAPFRARFPDQAWRWSPRDGARRGPHVALRVAATTSAAASAADESPGLASVAGTLVWHDRTGRLGLPLVRAAGGVFLHRRPCGSACDELAAVFPPVGLPDVPVAAPAYPELLAASALWTGTTWSSLGPVSAPAATVEVRLPEPTPTVRLPRRASLQDRRVRWLDAAWLTAGLAGLVSATVWIRRAGKAPDRKAPKS